MKTVCYPNFFDDLNRSLYDVFEFGVSDDFNEDLNPYPGPDESILVIPEGVELVYNIPSNPNIREIVIPSSLTGFFENCITKLENLETVRVNSGNKSFCSVDNVLYCIDSDNNLYELVCFPAFKDVLKFDVPDSVCHIADGAFMNNHFLKEVNIPDSVLDIGSHCFCNCSNLISVSVSKNVINIPDFAFSRCNNLNSIKLHDDIRAVEYCSFEHCKSLENIDLSSVTYIDEHAFSHCDNLKQVVLNPSLAKDSEKIFSDGSIIKFNLPKKMKSEPEPVFKSSFSDSHKKNKNLVNQSNKIKGV